MKLVVGLGNHGHEYVGTRHNMGYMAVEKFAEMANADFSRSDFKGIYGIINDERFPEKVIIAKPETYMNLSGEFVQAIASYYKIDVGDILVIYDDMALPEGKIRLRSSGSSGGQKGIQNIITMLGTDKIKRIRVGIGEPQHGAIDWVLGKPSGESLEKIEEATDRAAKAIRDILIRGFDYAMGIYNR